MTIPDGQAGLPPIPDHELLRRIGRGSYGEVWLARSTTGAYRAVKVVNRGESEDETPYEREFHGVRAFEPVSREHDAVVDVLHVGRAEDGSCFYYVMELADDVETGPNIAPQHYQPRTLRSELRRRGRLPVAECLEVATTLASALDHLHRKSLVHRDVKPSNVIYVNGRPKLADVGLVTGSEGPASFVGTLGYVAPEGPRGPASDLYSLGKVLYEISTGKDRQQYPELPTDLKEQPDWEARVGLNELILRACEEDPRRRYQTAAAMLEDIGSLQQGAPLPRRRTPAGRWWRWVVAIAFVLSAGLWLIHSVRSRPSLRQVGSFSGAEVPDWSVARVADWNGDGTNEIVCRRGNRLSLYSTAGALMDEWQPPDADGRAEDVDLDLLTDVDGDGFAEPFLSWRLAGQLHVGVLNRRSEIVKHFSLPVQLGRDREGRTTASGITAATLRSLDQDGQRQLLAMIRMGHGATQRGLACFSFETTSNLWFYPMAPNPRQLECGDLNGRTTIFAATEAPSNRVQVADTDDTRSYVFALSAQGGLAWKTNLWDYYSQVHLIVDEPRRAFYAWSSYSGEDLRTLHGAPPVGQIIRFDFSGKELGRHDAHRYLGSCWLSDSKDQRDRKVLATDRDGLLRVLPLDLSGARKLKVADTRPWPTTLELLTQADLDGDGRQESVLFYCGSQHVAGTDPSGRTKVVRHSHSPSILVLDSRQRVVAKHPLGELWVTAVSVSAWAGPLERGGPVRLLVLADRVYVFQYSKDP